MCSLHKRACFFRSPQNVFKMFLYVCFDGLILSLGQKPTFGGPIYIFLLIFLSQLNKRKKWESGPKYTKFIKITPKPVILH